MIRCACLIDTRGDTILLARVRDNELWYLPGGTIEEGETEVAALIREIDEELDVQLDPSTIRFDRTVIGPALGREGDVELNCYRADLTGDVKARAEISEIAYVPLHRLDKMAPAVRILAKELTSEGALA